jgi:transposase-like protein
MALMIAGTQFWLWRAVDDEGEVLFADLGLMTAQSAVSLARG